MSTWKSVLLAGAMAFAPVQAFAAQEGPEIAADAVDEAAAVDVAAETEADEAAAASRERMQREMNEAIAFVEKIFDTSDLPPVDPARLALAQTTTTALLPAGGLEKMMDNLYGKMFGTFLDELNGSSALMISIKTGVESEQVAALDDKSKEAIADLFDPHRKQRADQITKVVRPLISEVLTDIEGPMRDGMAKAYARKFGTDQLTSINAFFATPAGQSFANESLALQADPEIMLAVTRAIPPLVTKFMDRAPELEGEFKSLDLPMERQLADLNEAELKKLAKLLKVDVKALKEHRDMWNAAEAEDVEEADDFTYDRDTWSEADRQRVEALEAAYEDAYSAADDARTEAADNARKAKQKKPST